MIVNLTQHAATPSQTEAGVYDLDSERQARLTRLLTVEREVLVAPSSLRKEALDLKVDGILDLIWSDIVLATGRRARKVAAELDIENQIGAINTDRAPLFGAMIGGAPYLMERLAKRLREFEITPLYALTERVSVEETLPDGSVRKTAVFEHLGFEEAVP